MRTTVITIRADRALRDALARRARAQGRTVSDVAREILANALDQRPLATRTGHLKGRLALRRKDLDAWRKALRERNWRS